MKTTRFLLPAILVCIITAGFIGTVGQCKGKNPTESFRLLHVGKVSKDAETTTIEIFKEYSDALLGLDQFSHVVVLYWFDKNDTPEKRKTLRVHPKANKSNPLTGVFATRSPRRPNLIGLSVCRIVSVENNIVRIDSIDAFDGSPILDLKPYVARMDSVPDANGPQWAE